GCSQDGFPRFSRVRCFEQTPVTPVRPKIPESGNIGRFGILWMNQDAPNRATVIEPDVLPGAPTIARTINPKIGRAHIYIPVSHSYPSPTRYRVRLQPGLISTIFPRPLF